MAKAIHTCTGCVPIDASIIEAYVALITTNKNVNEAEEAREVAEAGRVSAEASRVAAEASRVDVEASRVNAEAARVVAENARETAEAARETQAESDHARAGEDHFTAVADHTQAGEDHTASETATDRANAAAAAAEHMVDIKQGPKGDQGNTGSSVDYPYELVNNVTTDDATKGLSAAQGVVLDGKISQLGQYVEEPEWVRVVTDSENKILYGVKSDGKFYFGDGCPPQVKEYVQEQIESIGIDALLATKVDKVAGKSLIDKDYADTKSAIVSDEWLNVVIDNEGKVLFGIRKETGEPYFPQNETYRVRSSNEWLAVWIDNDGHTLMGIRKDGTVYPNSDDDIKTLGRKVNALSNSITEIQALLVSMGIENIDWSAIPAFETTESLEWINAEVDADGKILSGTRADGSHYIRGVDSETIPKYFSDIDDTEGRMEIKTDKDGKILSYRKEDGTKVENYGVEYPSIKVGELNADFGEVGKHITEQTEIYVERPKFAEMRFYGTLPTDTSDARHSTRMSVKFIVDDNVIFHSLCDMAVQGHGTANFAKHNFSIDFLNANEEELSVKFGDMISIDGYHLKGNMTDRSQARTVGCAAIWREMMRRLDYPYFLVNNLPQQTPENYKADSLYISDAKYSEDGFPFALYVNDEFHGLYTCKLKKNRKNYAMEKSIKTEIFLDSITYTAYLNEVFNHEDWEVKNPKLSGYEEGGEITDAGVLASIERLFGFTTDITTQKEDYADYITLPHWLAYVIFCELVDHWDVNGNNTELCSWDGEHWSILPYDMDNTLLDLTPGFKMQGTFFATFRNLFEDELKDMYTMYRKSGMFDVSYLYQFFVNQVDSIPREIYDADYKKWGMENTEDRYLNILFLSKALKARIDYLDSVWLIQN